MSAGSATVGRLGLAVIDPSGGRSHLASAFRDAESKSPHTASNLWIGIRNIVNCIWRWLTRICNPERSRTIGLAHYVVQGSLLATIRWREKVFVRPKYCPH